MSYTISLGDIVEQIWIDGHENETHSIFELNSWKDSLSKIDEKIEYARPYLFSFDYACYGDEEDKKHLEQHIIRKYYTRDICCSSLVRWQLFLYNRLRDIMPRYNAIYTANLQVIENAINVLKPYEIEESKDRQVDSSTKDGGTVTRSSNANTTNKGTNTGDSTTTGSDTSASETVTKYSDTPQALMETNKDYLTNLTKVSATVDENYTNNTKSTDTVDMSNVTTASDSTTTSATGSENKTDNYVKKIKGNMSKYNMGELLDSYSKSIMSIEELISDDLADLFYLVY